MPVSRCWLRLRSWEKSKFPPEKLNLHNLLLDSLNKSIICFDLLNKTQMADQESKSHSDWQELVRITQGQPVVIERVRLAEKGIAIEGSFELPQLARLSPEDQVFVVAFVRSHGSIKEMEQVFGVSYPTVKARLTRIAQGLDFIENNPLPSRNEIFDRLRRGEITAQDAIRELESQS
jgi:hypothetical protein